MSALNTTQTAAGSKLAKSAIGQKIATLIPTSHYLVHQQFLIIAVKMCHLSSETHGFKGKSFLTIIFAVFLQTQLDNLQCINEDIPENGRQWCVADQK
jgi:hypothetical protein